MIVLLVAGFISASGVTVKVGIQNDWPVDIVLCAGDTNKDLTKFKEQLTSALVASGVAESRLNITASETRKFTSVGDGLQVMQDEWKILPNYAKAPYLDDLGRLRGPFGQIGKWHGLLCQEKESSEYSSAKLTFAGYCPVCPAGLSSRVHLRPDGLYDMYFASVQSTEFYGSGWPIAVFLYKVVGADLANGESYTINRQSIDSGFTSNHKATKVAQSRIWKSNFDGYTLIDPNLPYDDYNSYPISDKVVVEMTSKGNTHEIFINGKFALVFTDTSDTVIQEGSPAYGCAFAQHTGIESAEFEIGSITPLIDAVRSPSYVSGSSRFIVDVCDNPREDFSNPEKVGELSQRMQADNAYYIGWGQSSSKSSIENFIRHNNGNGTYLRNTDSDIYQQTAKYIEPIVNRILTGKATEYLLKDYSYGFTQTYN